MGQLTGVAREAVQAEAALRAVVLWASWRLLGWIMAALAAVVVLGWLASTAVLWWDTGTIAEAQVRKAELQADVGQFQVTYDRWVQAGMVGKLEHCGPKARPCIRVDESAGPFESQGHADYQVIQGY